MGLLVDTVRARIPPGFRTTPKKATGGKEQRDEIKSSNLGTSMAGPSAGILLRESRTGATVARAREAIGRLTARFKGDNFWIDGRPLVIAFGEEYEGELQEVISQGLPAVLGWTPVDSLTVA